ncbi:hypothetical protein KX272_00005, partial [Escherichia coli]|nr:hypothetical protein [Escherichia coli]
RNRGCDVHLTNFLARYVISSSQSSSRSLDTNPLENVLLNFKPALSLSPAHTHSYGKSDICCRKSAGMFDPNALTALNPQFIKATALNMLSVTNTTPLLGKYSSPHKHGLVVRVKYRASLGFLQFFSACGL